MNAHQEAEFRKCGADFKYFCQNYIKITNPQLGLVNFRLYPFQERVISEFASHRFNIVRKFRQAGLTTVASIYGLWLCMFDLDQRVLLISKTDREAVKVGADIASVIEHLPKWLRPEMRSNAKHEKEFTRTNGVMWFYTPEAARSRSASWLILDEAAFIKKMPDHWAAMYPVLAAGGKCAVISTVNGMRGDGEWYYDTYTKAEQKRNNFNVINLSFQEHPEYAKPEFEAITRPNLGEKRWAQEFLGTFHGSGETYLSPSVLHRIHGECEPPVRKLFPDWDTAPQATDDIGRLTVPTDYDKGAMWQWEFPQVGAEYLVAADCSHGMGEDGDNSAIVVMNLETFDQVAEFQSNTIDVLNFAQLVATVGQMYNEAKVVIESNSGPGCTVTKFLVEKLAYSNLYYSASGTRDVPGVKLTGPSREMVLETMRTCLTQKLFRVKSVRLWDELQSFVVNRTKMKAEAARGKHDDLVMALAVGLSASDAMSQEAPVTARDLAAVRDVVRGAILGEGLDRIREAFQRDGEELDEDWLEEMDGSALLPERGTGNRNFRRPNEDLLRSFGM